MIYYTEKQGKIVVLLIILSVSCSFPGCHQKKARENPGVYLNEIMASNKETMIDDNGEFPDWIELYNSSDKIVSLKDFGLSDDPTRPLKWVFPDVVILPGQYLVVFASGSINEEENIYLHTSFKLNTRVDLLFFCNPDGFILDSVEINGLEPDSSLGRSMENPGEWIYLPGPTPGYKNDWEDYRHNETLDRIAPLLASGLPQGIPALYWEQTETVRFSHKGGYFTGPQYVEMNGNADKILYTLDGSMPDENSRTYTSPLLIEKTTVVRARGMNRGTLLDKVTTCTFLFNKTHDLPVISLVTDPENLWDPRSGILAPDNIEKKIEQPVHVEFFENNGQPGFRLDAGIRLYGHSSRLLPQRPFYILTRKRYGRKTIKYIIFPDKDTRIFKSILLRNGGEDGYYSRIRDTVTSTLIRELGVDAQATRPVVVYINGEYRGQYNLRDKIDEYFLAYHHHIPNPFSIDLIEGNGNVMAGTCTVYNNIKQYISSHDVRDPEVYEYIKTQVDIDNLINYELAQIYFANTDMGNIRCWRECSPRGKWRWILFDTDWSLFVVERNAFRWNLDPEGRGYVKYFSTLIITNLLKNKEFKTKFINQCIHLLNTTFSSAHVIEIIERIAGSIKSEMPAHCERWQVSIEEWERQVEMVREFARKRPFYVLEHLKSYFGLKNE
ncbi:MAG: CotH kinase family protein [Spirochaetales bacterium]|nr:CotH kinase family protein [Spirochaetales bacterium]